MDKHKKMSTQRHSIWSVTINNPTSADEEEIARARQKGWKVEGQLEKGENGTPHYQLMVNSGQVRFSAVKKAFTRAHIEPARNKAALEQYVHKEDTKIGELVSSNEFYPSLSKFWKLVYKKFLDNNWLLNFDPYDSRAEKEMCKDFYYDIKFPRDTRVSMGTLMVEALDYVVAQLVEEGYHVEHFLSPPNISSFRKFHFELLIRARKELSAEETARQTDTRSDTEEDIPHINIPTNANDEEEALSEETGRSSLPSPQAIQLPPSP